MKHLQILLFLCAALLISSCRDDDASIGKTEEDIGEKITEAETPKGGVIGFYLLNEGNMGMNKASLAYFDYTKGTYHKDIYATQNPNVIKELGDVGNDIKIYGSKAYIAVNVSGYIEIIDVKTTKHLGSVNIPNVRYLSFANGKAYASAYTGAVAVDPNAEKGSVFEIDTINYSITRKVTVGYQPEEMVAYNNKLYVANSGGYRVPEYDNTISVIDLNTFKETKKIAVEINLHRMQIDKRGDIYVSSRGDYYQILPKLFVIDSKTEQVKQKLDIPVGNMTISGDSLYYYSVAYSHDTGENITTYGMLNTNTKQVISNQLIKDGTDKKIMFPYGIAVHPKTKEFYITDAQNYVSSGYIYCFNPNGSYKWHIMAGNIPAHFAFVYGKNN